MFPQKFQRYFNVRLQQNSCNFPKLLLFQISEILWSVILSLENRYSTSIPKFFQRKTIFFTILGSDSFFPVIFKMNPIFHNLLGIRSAVLKLSRGRDTSAFYYVKLCILLLYRSNCSRFL